jgi:hypothetical protein
MTKINTTEIKKRALGHLDKAPQGIRYMDLVRMVHQSAPETPVNTVHGAFQDLLSKTKEIVRPSRGLWVLAKHAESGADETAGDDDKSTREVQREGKGKKGKPAEEQFYQPFADWLRTDVEEVNESLVMGGKAFKNKWGTPDVIGVYKPRKSDPISFPVEIVSAELKIDPAQSVVAFGQACAYRLFSHKTYVVMPSTIEPNDEARLHALCSIYGVGLVLFTPDLADPRFQEKVKAQRFEPDMFYANEFARRLHEVSKSDFDRLF